jgi:hypothetical protein
MNRDAPFGRDFIMKAAEKPYVMTELLPDQTRNAFF